MERTGFKVKGTGFSVKGTGFSPYFRGLEKKLGASAPAGSAPHRIHCATVAPFADLSAIAPNNAITTIKAPHSRNGCLSVNGR